MYKSSFNIFVSILFFLFASNAYAEKITLVIPQRAFSSSWQNYLYLPLKNALRAKHTIKENRICGFYETGCSDRISRDLEWNELKAIVHVFQQSRTGVPYYGVRMTFFKRTRSIEGTVQDWTRWVFFRKNGANGTCIRRALDEWITDIFDSKKGSKDPIQPDFGKIFVCKGRSPTSMTADLKTGKKLIRLASLDPKIHITKPPPKKRPSSEYWRRDVALGTASLAAIAVVGALVTTIAIEVNNQRIGTHFAARQYPAVDDLLKVNGGWKNSNAYFWIVGGTFALTSGGFFFWHYLETKKKALTPRENPALARK